LTYAPLDYQVDTNAVDPITPGKRLLNVHLTRQIDACPRNLHDDMPSNGRFKVIIYSSDIDPECLEKFGSKLSTPESFLNRFTVSDARNVAPVYETVTSLPANQNFTFDGLLIHILDRHTYPISSFPAPFNNWRWRVFQDSQRQVSESWGLKESAAIIVRPDGYVGLVAGLEERFVTAAGKYFEKFLVDAE